MRTVYRETNGEIVKETAPLPKRGSQFQEMTGANMIRNYYDLEQRSNGNINLGEFTPDQIKRAWSED